MQYGGQFAEPLEGHCAHDGVLPLEVAVEDRLAVFDAIGQSAGGDRLPAFGLSQLPGGVDDDLAPLLRSRARRSCLVMPLISTARRTSILTFIARITSIDRDSRSCRRGSRSASIRLALTSTTCGVTQHHRTALAEAGGLISKNQRRITMTDSQTDGRTLAERYLTMLNDHDPDAVDGFVAVDYINHNPFVDDGREANRPSGRASSLRFQTSK